MNPGSLLRLLCPLFLCTQLVAGQPPPPDAQLAAGIRQVEEGDLEGGLATLDGVARKLAGDQTRTKDLAQAYLYEGLAYVLLDQEKAGKAAFREALKLDSGVRLEKSPAKVRKAFESALAEHPGSGATAQPSPGGSSQVTPSQPAPPTAPAFEEISVIGNVERSGKYAYKPGMTVKEALELAGARKGGVGGVLAGVLGGVVGGKFANTYTVLRVVAGKENKVKVKPDDLLLQPWDTVVVR